MKRQFFILSLSALTLFSCGGSQNTKTNENAKPAKNLTTDYVVFLRIKIFNYANI
ncbi:MAG: hypothetical protein K5685_09180 [Bacteroidales bacterium]|nr:hypothetical protein [Bacteroidales bacterium]